MWIFQSHKVKYGKHMSNWRWTECHFSSTLQRFFTSEVSKLSSSPKVTKDVCILTDLPDVVQWTNRKEYVLFKILHFCSNFIQFVNYFYHVIIDISIQFSICHSSQVKNSNNDQMIKVLWSPLRMHQGTFSEPSGLEGSSR